MQRGRHFFRRTWMGRGVMLEGKVLCIRIQQGGVNFNKIGWKNGQNKGFKAFSTQKRATSGVSLPPPSRPSCPWVRVWTRLKHSNFTKQRDDGKQGYQNKRSCLEKMQPQVESTRRPIAEGKPAPPRNTGKILETLLNI